MVANRPSTSWVSRPWLRWTLAYLTLFAIAASLIAASLQWRANDLLTGQAFQLVAAEARGLSDQYRIGGLPLLVQATSARSRQPGGGLYLLVDGTGARLAGNLLEVPAQLRDDPAGGLFHYQRPAIAGGSTEQRAAVGLAIRVGDQAQLVVGRDISDIGAFARTTRALLVAAIALMSLLALAGAAIHGRALARRVDAVTAASRLIMAGDLTRRLPVAGGHDEIDRLSDSVNVMLGRIEELLAGLREVSDNIAHDLKTPLTRLRNRAEAALRDPTGEPALRDGLEHTLEEADELIKTFNALLSIARLEAGASAQQAQPIDLMALVEEAVELYEPVVEEAGLRIAFEAAPAAGVAPRPPSGVLVVADRQLIGQALANLIENAMKYGCDGPRPMRSQADGADITVGLHTHDGWAQIQVADRGPGIPAADRERVLKRFVRLETSRTRPGTGLGLSLVAAVARAHKGTVRLDDNAPGLRVTLALPLAPG